MCDSDKREGQGTDQKGQPKGAPPNTLHVYYITLYSADTNNEFSRPQGSSSFFTDSPVWVGYAYFFFFFLAGKHQVMFPPSHVDTPQETAFDPVMTM